MGLKHWIFSDTLIFFNFWMGGPFSAWILVRRAYKGCAIKNLTFDFFSAHISAFLHWIHTILVPTPHNIPLMVWGRHKNIKDPRYRRDKSKTKIEN